LYDLEDNVSIDKIKFLQTFEFVEETLTKRQGATVALSIISGIFFFIGIVGLVFVISKSKKAPQQDYAELEN
jgi:hypothetical protein